MGIGASLTRGFDLAVEALRETIEFHKQKFTDYIKYYLAAFAAGAGGAIGMLIPLVALFYLIYTSSLSGTALLVAGAALGALALALAVLGYVLATSSIFASIRFVATGKKERYFQGEDYMPALKYILFYAVAIILIYAVLLGVPFLFILLPLLTASSQAGTAAASAAVAGMFAGIILFYTGIFIAIIAFYAFIFFYIYGVYEIAEKRIGPLDALKRSYALVKNNFWETLLFFIVMMVVAEVLQTLLSIVIVPFFLLAAISFVFWVAVVLVAIAVSIIATAALGPAYVFFWDKIRKTQGA